MAPPKKSPSRPKYKPSSRSSPKILPFVFEIGTEELPSAFLPQALKDLEALGERLLAECRLPHGDLRTMGTPRRLVMLVEDVHTQQEALTQEIVGPPASAAFDAAGHPTKAAHGFAGSQGVGVEHLHIKETPKGNYVAIEKHQRGRSAKQVLSEALFLSLGKLNFPKAMRWNASRVKFARPIRWIVALLGDEPITLEFAGIQSGARTFGHRFYRRKGKHARQGVVLAHARRYLATMKREGVLVDPEDRRNIIQQQVADLARAANGRINPLFCEELIEEAVWGVEYPHAILGSFPDQYLAVPKPVLISSMKEHQGFFSLVSNDGALLPKFIAVTNMPWGDSGLIKKGNERVLAARLSDAKYFYTEDAKQPLQERVPALEGVLLHHQLGTVRQKVDRLCDLVGWIADHTGRKDLLEVCRRAAFLAKADLTTGMVGEFPTLQGIIGEEYARHDREPEGVCRAIGEQYFPRFPDDQLPATLPGVLLAVADRCDTIVSFFAAGLAPSGSEDPLGLRRAAFGLVRIVIETPIRLNMVSAVEYMLQILWKQGMVQGRPDTGRDVVAFLLDRLRFYGGQRFNLREDIMEAVTRLPNPSVCDLADLFARMQALQGIAYQPDFDPLMVGFKRAHRIVEKEQWMERHILPERFLHQSEQRLVRALAAGQQQVNESMQERNYEKALHVLLELKSPIDEFFDSVMVNDSDPQIRGNRLSLLKSVDDLFLTVADLSCLQPAHG